MKKLLLKIGLTFMLSILLINVSNAQHFSTIWAGYPYQPMTIIVQDATINGVALESGDEIAVFDIGDGGASICVGTLVLTGGISAGAPAIITASADEPGGSIEGYTSGNTIVFKLWDNSESAEITMVAPTFMAGFDQVYTTLGTAIVTTLVGSTSVETIATSVTNCPGSFIIPVDVQNLMDVGQFSLVLDYGTTNLTYSSYQSVNTQLASGTLSVTENSGEITISWSSTTAANIASGTLLELVFTASSNFSQTTENLTWDEANSYYQNTSGTGLDDDYTDGIATIDPIPENAGTITGSTVVCRATTNESYQVGAITNATSYSWELVPASSGTISTSGTSIIVDFASSFSGQTILSVAGVNTCGNGTASQLTITVNDYATADAGPDATTCSDATYTLSGSASNYSSLLWTTTGDGTFDDSSLLGSIYTPGSADISTGLVTLTLTAYSISPCTGSASDAMDLTILPSPTANAGSDASICENNTYTLSGSASNYSTILWSTSGDGTFNDATILTPIYTPGVGDIASGSVIITLTASSTSANCSSASDAMGLTLNDIPIVDAGIDDTIPNGLSISLSGSASGGLQPYVYSWSPVGTLSNANIANPVANPTTTTTYTLSVTDDNSCSDTDDVEIAVYEYFETVWTGYPYQPMTILLSGATLDGVDFSNADEIGIFDVDGSGNEICVGYAIITAPITPTSPLAITVSTDDPSTTEIDGFTTGNTIIYKSWTAADQKEYSIYQASYNPTFDNSFTPLGTALVAVDFVSYITQSISLYQGWNIISFYVAPDDMNLLTILDPLVTTSTLTKVINEEGKFIQYIPGIGWMNTIVDMANTEGYYIKVTQNSSFDATGMPIVLPLAIPLNLGWNIMGYPVETPEDALVVLDDIITANELTKVINEEGKFIQYIPGIGWMNTIGNFEPGEGYYIKVVTNTSLTIN